MKMQSLEVGHVKPLKKASGVALMRGDLVLLCERLPGASGRHVGCWGGTGGLCEANETDYEAAARETREESGIIAPPWEFVFLHKNLGETDDFRYVVRHYLLRLKTGQRPERLLPEKHGPWVEKTMEEALALKLVPGLDAALREVVRRGL